MPLTSMRGWRARVHAASVRSESGARSRRFFRGLAGLTSHHIRSSPRRCRAIRLALRWPSCAGLKLPPKRPIFSPGVWGGSAVKPHVKCGPPCPARKSRPGLTRSADTIFERGELIESDRSAGMHPARGNTDLASKTEFAAVGELRRCIVKDDRRFDLPQEPLRRLPILGDDAVGVMRAMGFN